MSEGEFVNMRPHNAEQAGRKDIDESTDTYDTIDWLVKNVPNNNGKVGMWGISYPGFYTAAGMIDAHPGAEGRLAAGADHRLVHRRRLPSQRRALPAAHASTSIAASASRGRSRRRSRAATLRPRHARRLRVLPRHWARSRTSNEKYFKGDVAVLERDDRSTPTYDEFWQARNLRPHLKNIKPAVLTVGGWFDAEDLFGALETYQRDREEQPGDAQHAGDGPVVHGGWRAATATRSATSTSARRPASSTARRSSCRSSSTT